MALNYKISDYDAFLGELKKCENAVSELEANLGKIESSVGELVGTEGLLELPEKVLPIFTSMRKSMQEMQSDFEATTKHLKEMAGALVDVAGRDADFFVGV